MKLSGVILAAGAEAFTLIEKETSSC